MTEAAQTRDPAAVPLAFLLIGAAGSLYAWLIFFTTFRWPGAISLNYNAPGADFMVFHSASALARSGDVATLFDPDRFTALLNARYHGILSKAVPFRPWVYPPSFLILLLPFGAAGFALACWSFQAVTAALLAAALRTASGPGAWRLWLAVLLCPAAALNMVSGQTGFLVAALLTAGGALMHGAPVAAGVALGLLSFKPQFFLLVPVVLLAARDGRAILSAGVTAGLLALAPGLLFGFDLWTGWLATLRLSLAGADPRWVEMGQMWGISVTACALSLGASPLAATIAQAVTALLAAACAVLAFYRPSPPALRAAVLLAAAVLAAPHAGNYDLLLVAASALLLAWHMGAAVRPWLLLILAAWLMPLFGIPALTGVALAGPLVTGLVLALACRQLAPPPAAAWRPGR